MPMRALGCAVFLACSLVTSAWGQPERVIGAAAAIEDVKLARRALTMVHPGLTRYTGPAEITRAFDDLEAACARDLTEREFYARLSTVLAKIRCSHTKAEPSPAWAKWREEQATYWPFRVAWEGDRVVITASAADGVVAGDELVAVNGVPALRIAALIDEAIPADGWSAAARRHAFGRSSDLDACELDHYAPAFFDFASPLRLEIRGPGALLSRSVTATLLTKADRAKRIAEPAEPANLDEAVDLQIRPDGVATLRVRTFVAYRKKITPEAIYRPLFERLAAEKASALILDLRDNGGGSDSAAIDLARFLVDQPFTLAHKAWMKTKTFGDLADKLDTWDKSILSTPESEFADLGNGFFELKRPPAKVNTPLTPGFRGRLVVLCGPANASGATMFLAGLREHRQATFIGEPTGGTVEGPTAGVVFFLTLPNTGIRVRIPAIRSVTGYAAAGGSGAFVPDVVVASTTADRLAGRDPVLATALEVLGVEMSPPGRR